MKSIISKRLSRFAGAVTLATLACLLLLWSPLISRAATPAWGNTAPYQPRQVAMWAHPTNFGERFGQDVRGASARHSLIVVIHETVSSADSAVRFFQTPHYSGEDQASYHALIRRDGTIIYTVPFEYRAFGAGNSVFVGENGPETVQTNPQYPASVNNFAYHFSLETPEDGNHNGDSHSGYTANQYQSLAWLARYTRVPASRITYHKVVDRSGTRKDPRSFDSMFFLQTLQAQSAQPSPLSAAGVDAARDSLASKSVEGAQGG